MKTFEAKKQWIDNEGESNFIEIEITHNKSYYPNYKIDSCYMDNTGIEDETDLLFICDFFSINRDRCKELELYLIEAKKSEGKFKPSHTLYTHTTRYCTGDVVESCSIKVTPRVNNYKKDGKRFQDIYCGLDELINCDFFEQFIPTHRKEVFNNFRTLLTQVLNDIRKEYKLPREI